MFTDTFQIQIRGGSTELNGPFWLHKRNQKYRYCKNHQLQYLNCFSHFAVYQTVHFGRLCSSIHNLVSTILLANAIWNSELSELKFGLYRLKFTFLFTFLNYCHAMTYPGHFPFHVILATSGAVEHHQIKV